MVLNILMYASKARGDTHEDSDLDILLIIKEGDWWLKREIRDQGYELSVGTDVFSSIQVFTEQEWKRLKQVDSIFQENVENEGLAVR